MRFMRSIASSLMKLPCMTCERVGAMGFSRSSALEGVEQRVDGGAALRVRRQLPALVARRARRCGQLVGLDKQRAAGVGIGLPVKLPAEAAVGHALVGGADATGRRRASP